MKSKKPNLAAALHEASGKKAAAISVARPVIEQEGRGLPPSRVGKKIIAGHFDPAVIRQLKQLALDQEASVQQLLGEALNDLFVKHNLKPIA